MVDDLSQASIASQLNGPTDSRLRWSAEYFEENFKRDNGVSLLELVRSSYFKGLEIIPSCSTLPELPQPILKEPASISPDDARSSNPQYITVFPSYRVWVSHFRRFKLDSLVNTPRTRVYECTKQNDSRLIRANGGTS